MSVKETWVVEVQPSPPEADDTDGWVKIAECGDSMTAIVVSDALHNLMQSGFMGDHSFQIQTRMIAGER